MVDSTKDWESRYWALETQAYFLMIEENPKTLFSSMEVDTKSIFCAILFP